MTQLHFNGIDASTGEPLTAPISVDELAAAARSQLAREENEHRRTRLLPFGADATRIDHAGWGVVVPHDVPVDVEAALAPLLELRRGQAGPLFKRFDVRPGETARTWLARHGMGASDLDPEIVPYYLLLVGDPIQIPFELQYALSTRYCVGRLDLDLPGLTAYAASIVRAELMPSTRRRSVSYWAPKHDMATTMSAELLISPLFGGAGGRGSVRRPPAALVGATSSLALAGDATRAHLLDILHGRADERPALLFTASHGLGFPLDHPLQARDQGALLCQDWPGSRPPDRDAHYVAADHVGDDADVHGLVAFLFACYGAGTPAYENFQRDPELPARPLAAVPFVSALPRRLLGHPRGGALAVVGHVERAWGCSLAQPGVGNQIVPFHGFIARTLAGEPVGHALRDLADRVAIHSTALLTGIQRGDLRPHELINLWLERNDAQNYVLLGDPAARLTK